MKEERERIKAKTSAKKKAKKERRRLEKESRQQVAEEEVQRPEDERIAQIRAEEEERQKEMLEAMELEKERLRKDAEQMMLMQEEKMRAAERKQKEQMEQQKRDEALQAKSRADELQRQQRQEMTKRAERKRLEADQKQKEHEEFLRRIEEQEGEVNNDPNGQKGPASASAAAGQESLPKEQTAASEPRPKCVGCEFYAGAKGFCSSCWKNLHAEEQRWHAEICSTFGKNASGLQRERYDSYMIALRKGTYKPQPIATPAPSIATPAARPAPKPAPPTTPPASSASPPSSNPTTSSLFGSFMSATPVQPHVHVAKKEDLLPGGTRAPEQQPSASKLSSFLQPLNPEIRTNRLSVDISFFP